MATNIQIGKSGQDDTSGIEPQRGEISVPQRLNDLEKRAKDISDSFQKLERGVEKSQNFIYVVVGAIAIVFVITSILIAFDYFKYNNERYEKFINEIKEIKKDFYTKEQIDNNIYFSTNKTENQLNDFKKCLKEGGWNRCF